VLNYSVEIRAVNGRYTPRKQPLTWMYTQRLVLTQSGQSVFSAIN